MVHQSDIIIIIIIIINYYYYYFIIWVPTISYLSLNKVNSLILSTSYKLPLCLKILPLAGKLNYDLEVVMLNRKRYLLLNMYFFCVLSDLGFKLSAHLLFYLHCYCLQNNFARLIFWTLFISFRTNFWTLCWNIAKVNLRLQNTNKTETTSKDSLVLLHLQGFMTIWPTTK